MMDDPDTDPLTEFWQSSPGFSTTNLSSSLNLNFRKSSLSPPRESPAFSRSITDNTYSKLNSTKQQPKILKTSSVPSSSLSSSIISQSSSSLPSTSTSSSMGISPTSTIIPVTSPSIITSTPNSCPSPSKIVKFMVREKGDSTNSEPSILPLGINTSNNALPSSGTDQNKSKGQLPPPVLLKTMSAFELTQLEDYLHCVKCYRTFYKLETLVSHFKTCPGKPNGSFVEFMRKKKSDSNYDYESPSTPPSKPQKRNSSITSLRSPVPTTSQQSGGFTRLQDDDFEHDNDDMDYSDDFPMINSSSSILNEINMRNIWKSSTPSSSTNRNIINSSSSSNSHVRTPLRGIPTRELESDIDTDMLDLDSAQGFPSPLIASFLSNIKKNSNQPNNDAHSLSPSLYKNINSNTFESLTLSGKRLKGQVPHSKQYIITDPPSPASTLLQKVGKKGQIISSSAPEVKTYTPRKDDNEFRNSFTPFSCSHCPFVTGRNIDLMEHYEFKHPNIKVFKCPVVSCRESFLQESELKLHATVHEPKPVSPVRSSHMCPHCRKLFISREFLSSHTLRVHSNKNETDNTNTTNNKGTVSRPFACSFFPCQRTYTRLSKLKQHEKIHSDTKLHICNVCKKSFTFKQVYVDHLKTHNVPSNMDINQASTSTITPTTTTTMLEKSSQLQKILLQQNAQQVQIQQALSQPSSSLVAAMNKVNPNLLKNRVIKVIRVRGNANMPNILSSSGGTKTLVNVLSTNTLTSTTSTSTPTNSTTSVLLDPITTTTSTTTETIGENLNENESEIETHDITMENSNDFMKDFSSELNNNNDSNNESSNIVDDDSSQIQTENVDQSGEGEEQTQAVAIDSDLEQV